jgi:uncharacterized protein
MKIDSLDALRSLYGPAKERAVRKQLPSLDSHCRRFVALSPFVVLSSTGRNGAMDASPRGGAPGFVLAPDAGTLLLPDASGNNRLDTLQNIVETGRLGLLFMVPGIDETLRVNGSAVVSTDADLLVAFAGSARPPKLVIRVEVREAYLHCAKALMRSKLWSPERHQERSVLPTMGQMLAEQIGDEAPAETQAQMLARYTAEL